MKTWLIGLLIGFFTIAFAQDNQNWSTQNNPAVSMILEHLGKESTVAWESSDNTLTFAFTGNVTGVVYLCCGIQIVATQVHDNLYAVTARFQNLEKAFLSYTFGVLKNGAFEELSEAKIWRGKNAPLSPKISTALQGKISLEKITSRYLIRNVQVYTPPNFDSKLEHQVLYMADGQGVETFAKALEPAILEKRLPAIVLVGIDNGGGDDLRYNEYVQTNSSAFQIHEKFVLQDVIPKIDQKYGLLPQKRWLFGFSNGADWVLRMLALHLDVWAGGAALSPVVRTGLEFKPQLSPLKLYIEAGVYEEYVLQTAQIVKAKAQTANIQVFYDERFGGHDLAIWQEVLPTAMAWLVN